MGPIFEIITLTGCMTVFKKELNYFTGGKGDSVCLYQEIKPKIYGIFGIGTEILAKLHP